MATEIPRNGRDWILAVNAGSSSLKLGVFGVDGLVRIGSAVLADISVSDISADILSRTLARICTEHSLAPQPVAIGHRVVHGLEMNAPARLTADVLARITRAAALAPVHNPPALHMMDIISVEMPDAVQVACFDTAFHAANPPEATVLPLAGELKRPDLRRYGFHGLSYASVVRRFPEATGKPLPRRLLICHLGAGASIAAVRDGIGVATTMGFSPMDGLVMATRAGAMDPGVIFHLLRDGVAPDRLEDLLNRESGLLALGGTAAMKTLLEAGTPAAEFAIKHFCYSTRRHAGSMIAAMQGIDGLVFSGGIGENAPRIRQMICDGLTWTGIDKASIWVIPADEEAEIARATATFLPSGS